MTADADAAEAEVTEGGGKSKKKLIIIAAGALVLLLGGGAGGAYFMGFFDSAEPVAELPEGEAVPEQRPAVFYDLPEMTVNLSSSGRATYLKETPERPKLLGRTYDDTLDKTSPRYAKTEHLKS